MATAKKPKTTSTATTAALFAETTPSVAAKKPAAKKAVAKPAAEPVVVTAAAPAVSEPAAAPVKAKAKPRAAKAAKTSVILSDEQRNHYVEVAAFYIAEQRGFEPGNPVDDWCAAEAEIDRLIASGHFN